MSIPGLIQELEMNLWAMDQVQEIIPELKINLNGIDKRLQNMIANAAKKTQAQMIPRSSRAIVVDDDEDVCSQDDNDNRRLLTDEEQHTINGLTAKITWKTVRAFSQTSSIPCWMQLMVIRRD